MDLLQKCIFNFKRLIGTRYRFVIGKAGITAEFTVSFEYKDCHHLMGLQYIEDLKDPRGLEEILNSVFYDAGYRKKIFDSPFFTSEIKKRIKCAMYIANIIENENMCFAFDPEKLHFFSKIEAKYLLKKTTQNKPIFLFIDHRSNEKTLVCKSVFPTKRNDYATGQTKWTVLLKEKIKNGTSTELYRYKNFEGR